MIKILVVDDDRDIRELLKILLTNANYEVSESASAEEAVTRLQSDDFSLVILDLMMPQKDGFWACEEIRKTSNVPVLFLTARGQEYDKIIGFSTGCDDYLVKPFIPSELISRAGALVRRFLEYGGNKEAKMDDKRIISIGELLIDEDFCKVTVSGEEKSFTAKEYEILLLLCKTRGKVFSAKNIYESVWNETYFHTTNNTVMVHIRKIREKIERNPQKPEYLKTVWGMGYKIEN